MSRKDFETSHRHNKCQTRALMFDGQRDLPGYVGLTGPEHECVNEGGRLGAITENTEIIAAECDPDACQKLRTSLSRDYPCAQVFNRYLEDLQMCQLPKKVGLVNNDVLGNVDATSLQWLRAVALSRLVQGGCICQTMTKHYRGNQFVPAVIKLLVGTQEYTRASHDRDITNNITVPNSELEIATVYYLLFRDYVLHGYDFEVKFCFYNDTQDMGFMKCYNIKKKKTVTGAPMILPDKKGESRPRIRQHHEKPPVVLVGKTLSQKLANASTPEQLREVYRLMQEHAQQSKGNPNMSIAGIKAGATRIKKSPCYAK